MANYLCSKRQRASAYLELNGTREIGTLSHRDSDESFSCQGIRIFPNCTFTRLTEQLDHSYDYLVLDLGVLNPNNYNQFLQNDLCLVVGSVLPWKQAQYGAFLQKYFHGKQSCPEHVRCLASFGIKEDLKKFAKSYHFTVTSIPYLENPLQLSPVEWHFLQTLLEDSGF